eukprot:scaffold5629_cov112-Isochrysis_galbana.AAC.2
MTYGEHESMQPADGKTLSRPTRATPEETTGPSRGPNMPLREASHREEVERELRESRPMTGDDRMGNRRVRAERQRERVAVAPIQSTTSVRRREERRQQKQASSDGGKKEVGPRPSSGVGECLVRRQASGVAVE